MKIILDKISGLPQFQEVMDSISAREQDLNLGLLRAARLPILAAIHQAVERPVFLITHRTNRALSLMEELHFWMPEKPIAFFPEPSTLFYEEGSWGENTRRERLFVLSQYAQARIPGADKSSLPIVIAPARAIMTRTMPRHEYLRSLINLKPGKIINLQKFNQDLVRACYERVNTVISTGQFAQRGGIVDIWSPNANKPARIEFFGDEVDTIRTFNTENQRTIEQIDTLMISPAKEFINSTETNNNEELTEFSIPEMYSLSSTVLDYLPKNALVMIDNQEDFRETVTELEEQAVSFREQNIEEGLLNSEYSTPYISLSEIEDQLSALQTIILGPTNPESEIFRAFSPGQRYGGQLRTFLDDLIELAISDKETVIVSRQSKRLKDLWLENQPIDSSFKEPVFLQGTLADGFFFQYDGFKEFHLFSDGEVFGWSRPQPRKRVYIQKEPPEAPYVEFQPGSSVVHIDHGIGVYKGLVKRVIEGQRLDYICIEYAEGDELFVPVHQVDRVSQYIGGRGRKSPLSRLGGTEWQSAKSKVKHAVREIAADLLTLYAERQVAAGHAFASDSEWQQDLEASFPYIETNDQLRVLKEVKQDMEDSRPMDRLICGDVGYGKTEVALRAAFKAVMDGKQVAVLVPTTVLAQQHYRTFLQRLAAFPVSVEMLSRFRSPAQQRKILKNLDSGELDIVIGTHRLVSSDVAFKDLGLVIIDEEQRFGVTHKEHLKRLRTEVDVLTLTATPIPRTLYMALTGVRDISTIDTPPEERLPISTHVGPFNKGLTRKAIVRELERGGQVFFVHNRVHSIRVMRDLLVKLVPEAKFMIAHGQMPEKELASRMLAFREGEVDVLISTTIIESGLDIPNANTLIVDRADTFGLAQLYQLRGRVGRGAQRAYAYFFKNPQGRSTEESKMRLETLAENTQLGAGYNIAMRDLEIRGAGDVLGARQSGHIAAIGFHLYTRLLTSAVKELRDQGEIKPTGSKVNLPVFSPIINIDLPIQVNIPEDYIPDMAMRLKLYRRMADIKDLLTLAELETEFEDRFGTPPEEVQNMLYQLKVKILAEKIGLASINVENKQLALKYPESHKAQRYPALPEGVRAGKNGIWINLKIVQDWRTELISIMEKLLAIKRNLN